MKKNCFRYSMTTILVIALGSFLLLWAYSRSAALIFNRAMEDQTVLRGTVAVEKLTAHLTGRVDFEGLEWKDPEGRRILFVPEGSFRVSLTDILTRRLSSTTIKELTLRGAALSLRLTEDGGLDLIVSPGGRPERREKKEERKEDRTGKSEQELLTMGERKRQEQREKLEKEWKNFNRENKRIAMKLVLDGCRVEVFYRARQYLMDSVRLRADIDTRRAMTIKAETGPFGGTMIGNGISLSGRVDFAGGEVPSCDLGMFAQEVDPSSLGFGMDIHDPMTLSVRFAGPVTRPVGTGTIHMERLRIPGLDFSEVDGTLRYEDAMFRFDDVTASVYEGSLKAEGWYNIDSRYYQIDGHGEDLRTNRALPGQKLSCSVAMDIHVRSKGNVQTTSYEGNFSSGAGQFRRVSFNSIRGRFHDIGRDLDFYDVVIDFGGIKAMTDILCVHSGKLTLAPIYIMNDEGRLILVYHPDTKEVEEVGNEQSEQ